MQSPGPTREQTLSCLIKICGLTEPEGLRATIEAGADLAGFVLFSRSPRFLSPEAAARLLAPARGRIKSVALLVDPDDAEAGLAMQALQPDWLQLHGNESPARVATLKARFDVKIIKALGVAGPADLVTAAAFDGIADLLLLDARPPAGAARPGGHGVTFDWTLLGAIQATTPFLLAGGLNPANVAEAIRAARAIPRFRGLDVSSGVEHSPGLKDASAIAAFVRGARDAAGDPVA